MKQFACFRLDTVNECLWRGDEQLTLTPRPFAVLRYLAENPRRLVTHDELLEALWPETYVQPQVLRTYVLELRKLLGDNLIEPRFIQTVHKRGYRFVADVHEVQEKQLTLANARIAGREEELAILRSHLERALQGKRQIVFLTGDAGTGKTALIDAFCAQVCSDGGLCMARGHSLEGFGGKEPFYPVREALSQLEKPLPESPVHGWLEGKSAAPALGLLSESVEALAHNRALLLVLEDLHWADAFTLDLVSALARRRTKARLLLVASYPASAISAAAPLKELKQDLITRRLASELALGPLNRQAVKDYLLRELQTDALPAGLASFVHQHSEGNALFMVATLNHLRAQRLLLLEDCRWQLQAPLAQLEIGVPGGLAGMIELQLEHLTLDERRLLEAGSIVGSIFPAWAAAAALGKDLLEIEDQCEALGRRVRLLSPAGQDELPDGCSSTFYVFAHALYREALYAGQSASRRTQSHLRIAEKLRTLFAGRQDDVALELAAHYQAAGEWTQAIQALQAAARQARHRGMEHAAAALLDRALALRHHLNATEAALLQRTPHVRQKKY